MTIHFQTPQWLTASKDAADALRFLARNEDLKQALMTDARFEPIAKRVSQRFVAGETIDDALRKAAAINLQGHAATIDYMGESCRDRDFANHETSEFLKLIAQIGIRQINASISLDISHIGSLIDEQLGFDNLLRITRAAQAIGQEVMISMEGSERTDATLSMYRKISAAMGDHAASVGITIQARVLRTDVDLTEIMKLPGRIRLVKGAYDEPKSIAFDYEASETTQRYVDFAKQLLLTKHRCSIATSDETIQDQLHDFIAVNSLAGAPFEFEILMGLGSDRLGALRARGYPTREYVVFGQEWFLYVCNRIADRPHRALTAIADAIARP